METIGKIILAGLITGVVFILFLYSPVVSPELYQSKSVTGLMIRPGVHFVSKTVKSAELRKKNSHADAGFQVSNPFPESRNPIAQIKTDAFDPFGQNSGRAEDIYATSRSLSTYKNGGLVLSNGIASDASGKSDAPTAGTQSHGFLALRTDVSTVGTTSSAAASDVETDITNPGDQPTGDVLPLSDGLGILLLLATGFAGWKKNRLRKKFGNEKG